MSICCLKLIRILKHVFILTPILHSQLILWLLLPRQRAVLLLWVLYDHRRPRVILPTQNNHHRVGNPGLSWNRRRRIRYTSIAPGHLRHVLLISRHDSTMGSRLFKVPSLDSLRMSLLQVHPFVVR